jgi:hypothetical protein
MSTSPIRTVFETSAPTDLVNIQRPTAGGFSGIDASVPLEAIAISGEWLPEVSVPLQGGTMDEIIPFRYIKVGPMVFFSGFIYFTLEATSTSDSFTLSLGDSIQPSNNFTTNANVVCTVSRISGIITSECILQAYEGSKNLAVGLSDTTEGAALKLTFSGSYNINN